MTTFEDSQLKIIFVKTLCGKYSNQLQSYANPKLYAHINIYFRLLPWELFQGIGIYSEQSYNHSPWSPYRQAIHRLSFTNNIYTLENYKLINHERIAGGGFRLELLKGIEAKDLILREGCQMSFIKGGDGFYKGNLSKNKKCIINKCDKSTYLISKVVFGQDKFSSLDEGFDIHTDEKIWGSDNGKLEFYRAKTPSK